MMLVTGATGFLGGFVVEELLKKEYEFSCFVRETSEVKFLQQREIELRYGDLGDRGSLEKALEDVDTIVNLASLGFGHAPNIVQACEESEVKRGVFISTTAIFTKLNADSKAVRLEAERLIRESSIDYTIIRPTMIYGTEGDRNMFRLIRFLNRFPAIPVLGPGSYLLQPVYVRDLARVVVDLLEVEDAIRNEYNIAGAESLSYNEVIDATAKALGKRVYKLHIPLKLSVFLLKIYERISSDPRLTAEQALRLNEDKDFAIEKAREELDYSPLSFPEGIEKEVERGRKLGLI